MANHDPVILGLETSCDETAAAVVSGSVVLSNIVQSQSDLHAPYGGVVPEVAARAHLAWLPPVIGEAVARAGLSGFEDIDLVAATRGPGLAGSLIAGFSAAKGLALRLDKPLVAVNHIEAHILSALLAPEVEVTAALFPALALVVSGGHTLLYRVAGVGEYSLLGRTLDDAAGEAFDKGASLLGLSYPGGGQISRLADDAPATGLRFPRGRPRAGNPALDGMQADLCWSFSGLKTSLKVHLEKNPPGERRALAEIAAAYQEAIVSSLISVCDRGLRRERSVLAGGGVLQNRLLRDRLAGWAHSRGIRACLAPREYCGDNAVMVAFAAALGRGDGRKEYLDMDIIPANYPF